jgi:hypothetical protein
VFTVDQTAVVVRLGFWCVQFGANVDALTLYLKVMVLEQFPAGSQGVDRNLTKDFQQARCVNKFG